MSKQSVGFICGIFHPKLQSISQEKSWYFREDELVDVFREFIYKPVLFEHEGEPIGRVEDIKIANLGQELMCYIDIYPEGKFVMDRLEKGELLGLSVGYETLKFGKRRFGRFDGQEISITTAPAMETTWIVANYSNNEFRISKTGLETLTQKSVKKSEKSQIKMSEYKAGKEVLEGNATEKNSGAVDVEQLKMNYEKAVKEAALLKSSYTNLFERTVKPEFDATVTQIEENLRDGMIDEDTANSMKEYLKASSNSTLDGMISEKLTKVRATANIMGTIKRLNSQLEHEKSNAEKLGKVLEEQKKRPKLEQEVAGEVPTPDLVKRNAQDLQALDDFLTAKVSRPESVNHVRPVPPAECTDSLTYELRRYGLIA